MKKRSKLKSKDFDEQFDAGTAPIDFSGGVKTAGLSKTIKLPPMDVPAWIAAAVARIAQFQANSKTAVIRQLLVEALEARLRRA